MLTSVLVSKNLPCSTIAVGSFLRDVAYHGVALKIRLVKLNIMVIVLNVLDTRYQVPDFMAVLDICHDDWK